MRLKIHPKNKEDALHLYIKAIKEFKCDTIKNYRKKNKKRHPDVKYPDPDFFREKFNIRFKEAYSLLPKKIIKFEHIFPTRQSVMKMIFDFFKETDYTLSIINLEAWYERDVTDFIMKSFGMSWKEFKIYTLSIFPVFEDRIINNSLGRRIM